MTNRNSALVGNHRVKRIIGVSLVFLSIMPIGSYAQPSARPSITHVPFGKTPTGIAVSLYTLRNRAGMEVRIATYGGIVTSLTAPDRAGQFADVVLGFDTLAGYLMDSPYIGALIGITAIASLEATSY